MPITFTDEDLMYLNKNRIGNYVPSDKRLIL